MSSPILQNNISALRGCEIINKLSQCVNDESVKQLNELATAIQSKVDGIFQSQMNQQDQGICRNNLRSTLFPIAYDAKRVLEKIKCQSTTTPNQSAVEDSLKKIIQSFAEIQCGKKFFNNDGDGNDFVDLGLNRNILSSINSAASQILLRAQDYKETARKTAFDPQKTITVVPRKMVEESKEDQLLTSWIKNEHAIEDEKITIRTVTEKIAADFLQSSKGRLKNATENRWKSFRVKNANQQYKIQENRVAPTTHHKKAKQKLPEQLPNIYCNNSNGQTFIACGAINNLHKAKSLQEVLEKSGGSNQKPRKVLIAQLNSFNKESPLIEEENYSSLFLDWEGKQDHELKGITVAHLNHCLNAASNLKYALEDSISYSMNELGLGQLAVWVDEIGISTKELSSCVKDVSKQRYLCKKLDKTIKQLNVNLSKASQGQNEIAVRSHIQKTQNELNAAKVKLDELEVSLKKILHETAISAKEIASRAGLQTQKGMKLNILSRLISQQIYLPGNTFMDRVTEVEMLLLLGILLKDENVTIVANCKSGLDRTGFVKAIWTGMQKLLEQFEAETGSKETALYKLFEMITNIDDHTIKLDRILNQVIEKHTKHIVEDWDQYDSVKNGSIVIDKINAELDKRDNTALKNLWIYQQYIAEELFKIGIPATIESTGIAGLKYGHNRKCGVGANPHPFKRLPKIIMTDDGKAIKLHYESRLKGMNYLSHQLYKLHKWPTNIAQDLILRVSHYRGD